MSDSPVGRVTTLRERSGRTTAKPREIFQADVHWTSKGFFVRGHKCTSRILVGQLGCLTEHSQGQPFQSTQIYMSSTDAKTEFSVTGESRLDGAWVVDQRQSASGASFSLLNASGPCNQRKSAASLWYRRIYVSWLVDSATRNVALPNSGTCRFPDFAV